MALDNDSFNKKQIEPNSVEERRNCIFENEDYYCPLWSFGNASYKKAREEVEEKFIKD